MKTYTFPKTNNPRVITEVDALVDLFDHLEEKIRDYHLIGNMCGQRIERIEQTLTEILVESKPENESQKEKEKLIERIEGLKADSQMWDRREESARKNERNLFKIKRMIQKAFANGELEK